MQGIKVMYAGTNVQPSIPNYFYEISDGTLQLQAEVLSWYKLPRRRPTTRISSVKATANRNPIAAGR